MKIQIDLVCSVMYIERYSQGLSHVSSRMVSCVLVDESPIPLGSYPTASEIDFCEIRSGRGIRTISDSPAGL